MREIASITPVATGRTLMRATACWYSPAVEPDDLLEVDFDDRELHDGLYLIEEVDAGRVVWRGCRRFQRVPGQVMVDENGMGWWRPAELTAWRWRIAGRVIDVYRKRA